MKQRRHPSPLNMSPQIALVALVLLLASVPTAAAHEVDVPLRFDDAFIRQALLEQLYTGPDNTAVVWDNGTGCGYLKLREPSVKGAGDHVRVVTRAEARAGTMIGSFCLAPLQWDGFIEVFEEPQVSADQRALRFRVVDSNIYDAEWKKGLMTGKLWDLVKEYVHPRLEAVRIDVSPAITDLRDFLPLILGGADAARIQPMLDSIHLGGVTVSDTAVSVGLHFTVNPAPSAAVPMPEPTLNAEELQRWEAAWQRWDAFLTFVIKQLGQETQAAELRQALADVLIDGRFDILEALAPSAPGALDPTPALFLKTWERLAPVVRSTAATQPGAVALRYLSFIAAADALAVLDQMGPEIGLDISADGLRRLARIIAPVSAEDPLLYSTAVDPDLRQLLGFGPPLPPPDLSLEESEAWWDGWLAPGRAVAAEEVPPAHSLDAWVADRDNLDRYLQAVREVLDEATQRALTKAALPERYHEVYRRLVLATAWLESCWRQFVRAQARVTYMKSAVGSIGMMQVNEHVWRGVYDGRGLRWDIHYNGRAGAEILMHYLQDYAVSRKEDAHPGGRDNLARASYAAYNGGPGHVARYRKPGTSAALRRIDDLFWQRYQAVSGGKEAEVSRCLIGG